MAFLNFKRSPKKIPYGISYLNPVSAEFPLIKTNTGIHYLANVPDGSISIIVEVIEVKKRYVTTGWEKTKYLAATQLSAQINQY